MVYIITVAQQLEAAYAINGENQIFAEGYLVTDI
jgi:hypothetical protein